MPEQPSPADYNGITLGRLAVERAKTFDLGVEYTLEHLLHEYNWKKIPLQTKSQAGSILYVFTLNNADSFHIGGKTHQNQRKYIRTK
ncbi:MAG: DUF1413 domain-containing protein [Oscillospiraceae bacterium]|jgi:hypothetical protein|nr:DUF1413 domain-containing protein [Oscillospiraceae bacterium]